MKPIDMVPGFGPTRTEVQTQDGTWKVTVKPPAFLGGEGRTTTLTCDQYRRYQEWRERGLLLQDALPELSDDEREALMTGLTDAEFALAAGPPEEEQ